MDKYEYNLKLEQIKKFYEEENFEAAAEIADTINWNRVRNVNSLVKIGEIYEKNERFADARDILLIAYDRSPLGRMIIYHLAELAMKMGDLDDAQEYCDEFARIAPHDSLKYVLSYDISKAKGASYAELISILEAYKENEYQEKEAFELAELYHLNGQGDKCADACDELILWFGDGPYVEQALELKKKYRPLTKVQEEKYRQITMKREGITEIETETMVRAGEYARETVTIPEINVNDADKFSTVNLQAEIAEGIRKIMEAKKQGDVSEAMEDIQKVVDEFPYLQIDREEAAAEAKPVKDMLSMDSDGQISLVTDADPVVEKQITGQMTIQDVLENWNADNDAESQETPVAVEESFEEAKAAALHKAEDLMERLNELNGAAAEEAPVEEAPVEEAPEEEASVEEAPVEEAPVEEAPEEEAPVEEAPEEEAPEEEAPVEEAPVEEAPVEEENSVVEEEVIMDDTELKKLEDILPVIADPEDVLGEEAKEEAAEETAEEVVPEVEQVISEADAAETAKREAEEAIAMLAEDTEVHEEIISEPTIPMPDVKEAISAAEAQKAIQEEIEKLPLDKKEALGKLTDEMKYAFAYFVPIHGMEEQILDAVNDISARLSSENTATTGNLIITGEPGCGKTVLATTMIRVLQHYCGRPVGKVGKISAKALNNKDIAAMIQKIAGGCLIIEKAGNLSHSAAATLSYQMEIDRTGLMVVMEDTAKNMRELLSMDELFARKFSSRIAIPVFTNDELVAFARSYAKEKGYKIDDMAVLALYNRISNIQKLDHATTLGEVKDIVDAAIKKEAKWTVHKYFSILTAKRYTDDDRIVLTERNFS